MNKIENPTLLSLSGKIFSGKDTVAALIQKATSAGTTIGAMHYRGKSKWQIKKYAGKLKQVVSLLIGCTLEQLEDQNFKSSYNATFGMTVREILQKVGTEAMREGFHKNVWVESLFADYNSYSARGSDYEFEKSFWIITDTRFPNEYKAIEERGGLMINVVRGNSDSDDHASETSLDGFEFHEIIENNGSLEELEEKVRLIVQKYNL